MPLRQQLLALGAVAIVLAAAATDSAAGSEKESRPPESGAGEEVEVFFVTNRALREPDDAGVRFGGERGGPVYGTCRVEFEAIPLMGGVAEKVPFYVPTEIKDHRIAIESDSDAFWSRIAVATEATTQRDLVLFIHGYSYDFERGCDRAAEAQRVLRGEATVQMFTWPSNGRPTDYVSDLNDMEWSVPFLESVLRELMARFGPDHLHVVAHSMGSKGIIQVLQRLAEAGERGPVIGELLLVAPDFDSQSFVELLPVLRPMARGITLYASDKDTPLKVSEQLNDAPRLGQAGEHLVVAEGVETIDVTPAGRYQILGHEYFYFHPQVGADMVELLTSGESAAERSQPQPRTRDGLVYWEILGDSQ